MPPVFNSVKVPDGEASSAIVNKMRKFWVQKGAKGRFRADKHAPKWVKVRLSMESAFPTYFEESPDSFAQDVEFAIATLNKLKPAPDGPAYIGSTPGVPDYNDVTTVDMEQDFGNLHEVIEDAVELFDGMPNWAHPMTMCNVIPPGNKAGIIGAMLANTFGPNIIEGEYAWNTLKAEMEASTMLAKMIGWDTEKAGGLFTYGGSGCYLYGMKYALTRVLGQDTRCKGVRTNGKLLVSQQGHYCMMNSTDWLGLGMDNIVTIETDEDTNEMDVADLEAKMKHYQGQGIPIIAVVCTMGTTDAFAIDPVDKVRAIIDNNPNPGTYGNPFLYCDAVIGWSWVMFKDYNYDENPLQFDEEILPIIQSNYYRISQFVHADAIGTDFHKTGWAPYNCSLFMMKDLNDFRNLMTRPGSAYLQERTCYNPGLFTLEVSRSGSYAMAGWSTLKYLGIEGFRSVLGGVLQVEKYLRDRIAEEPDMVCVNEDDHGFVTLVRVYPEGTNAESQYERELTDPDAKTELIASNKLQESIANNLWDWFRSGNLIEGMYGPYTSYTSGFKPTDYNDDLEDPDAVIYAVKSFPMNVNVTVQTMETLIVQLRLARSQALSVYGKEKEEEDVKENCPMPYAMPNPLIPCYEGDGETDAPSETRVDSLLSGVGTKARKKGKKGCKGKNCK